MLFKFISLAIMLLCALVAYSIKIFLPEHKFKNDPMKRVRIIVRVRLGCILVALVLLFICIII